LIWLATGALALVVAALVLRPLWRARLPADAEAPELAFYRDQLAEIERDATAGDLTTEQAHSARTEVQRRLLAAASTSPSPSPRRGEGRGEGVFDPCSEGVFDPCSEGVFDPCEGACPRDGVGE